MSNLGIKEACTIQNMIMTLCIPTTILLISISFILIGVFGMTNSVNNVACTPKTHIVLNLYNATCFNTLTNDYINIIIDDDSNNVQINVPIMISLMHFRTKVQYYPICASSYNGINIYKTGFKSERCISNGGIALFSVGIFITIISIFIVLCAYLCVFDSVYIK